MHSAPILPRRRRSLLPGALVVLLHWWVALVAMDAGLPLPGPAAPDAGRTMIAARLLPAEAAPPPPAPEPLPLPDAPPPPLPLPPLPPLPALPAPLPDLPPAEPAMPSVPGDITPQAQPPAPPGPSADTGAAPRDGAPAAPAVPATAPEPAPQPAPAPAPAAAPRRYVVDMPPPAAITLDVARTDADGTEWSGEALLDWRLDRDTYRIRVEAGIRVVFARVNLVVLSSEGEVAATGFAPVRMTEKRRGRSLTATHFDWAGNRLTFSASQAAYPLVPGAQDKASVPLQLAAIARGDPQQMSGDIDILVGEDRDATVYRFKVVGREEIETGIGRLQTLHLTRPPQPGSYKSRLDIWLAPAHGWYPVQIRNTEASGAVTTQTVNNIVLNHSGS